MYSDTKLGQINTKMQISKKNQRILTPGDRPGGHFGDPFELLPEWLEFGRGGASISTVTLESLIGDICDTLAKTVQVLGSL